MGLNCVSGGVEWTGNRNGQQKNGVWGAMEHFFIKSMNHNQSYGLPIIPSQRIIILISGALHPNAPSNGFSACPPSGITVSFQANSRWLRRTRMIFRKPLPFRCSATESARQASGSARWQMLRWLFDIPRPRTTSECQKEYCGLFSITRRGPLKWLRGYIPQFRLLVAWDFVHKNAPHMWGWKISIYFWSAL